MRSPRAPEQRAGTDDSHQDPVARRSMLRRLASPDLIRLVALTRDRADAAAEARGGRVPQNAGELAADRFGNPSTSAQAKAAANLDRKRDPRRTGAFPSRTACCAASAPCTPPMRDIGSACVLSATLPQICDAFAESTIDAAAIRWLTKILESSPDHRGNERQVFLSRS